MNEPKAVVDYGQKCLICRNDAAAGRTICWKQIDEIRDMLDAENTGSALDDIPPSIPVMYDALDASPGASGIGERRAPGFVSTPPCTLHVVAMRDNRSKSYAVAYEWYSAGPDGRPDYTKPHAESDHAVRPVHASLQGLADAVAAETGDSDATGDVNELCAWLYERLPALTRLAWSDDLYRDLRDLREQLRAAIGDPPPAALGYCTNDILIDRHTGDRGPCGHPLYPPTGIKPTAPDEPVKDVPIVVCGRCKAVYDGLAQLRLRIAELKGAS